MNRKIETYSPRSDAILRWSDWTIELTNLHGVDELICPKRRTLLLDGQVWRDDPELAIAHGVAHLDLHLDHMGRSLTRDQENEAQWLALVRLDREPMGER